MMLTQAQILQFKNTGYLIIPEFESLEFCESVIKLASNDIKKNLLPIEYEADKHYPGAPASRTDEGGNTPRRLLGAFKRSPLLSNWATGAAIKEVLHQLLSEQIVLSQAHHNCIMTKHPLYSSRTGWHRDNRYWHFQQNELISTWLALTNEIPENGCLWVLPGSHKWVIESYQLDEQQFLRADFSRNKDLIDHATAVPLNKGDLLLFHSNLFHAAGRNTTEETKYSLVFTYRSSDNTPLRGTRSSSVEEISI